MFKFHSVVRRSGLALLVVLGLLLALVPTVAMAAPLSGMEGRGGHYDGGGCASYYMVHKGDSLSGIAAHSGVSVWALRDANGIGNPNQIYANQWLCIPSSGHHGGYGPVYGGHDMGHGGYGYGGNAYTVRAGDNLSSIAWRYHTSVRRLMEINRISNPNHIYSGQVLRIN